ncbi:hypothetical protein Tco_0086805 [Tanacetum coccineum]
MVAKNTKKTPQESASKQPATKRAPPKKPTTTTLVKPSKPTPAPTNKPSKRKLPQKIQKGKPSFQLVDEEEGEAHQKPATSEKLSLDPSFLPQGQPPVGGVAIRDPVSETIPQTTEVVARKCTTDQFILVKRDQAPHDSTTRPSSQPEDDTSEKVVQESSSTTDSERTENGTDASAPKVEKEQGEVMVHPQDSEVCDSCFNTEDQAIDQNAGKKHIALARQNPDPVQEDQTGSDSGKEHVTLAGPNPAHDRILLAQHQYPKRLIQAVLASIESQCSDIVDIIKEIKFDNALYRRLLKDTLKIKSLQPPSRDDDKVQRNHGSPDASASKQHPSYPQLMARIH